jgi:dolichol-phosphate mannosyltransferase
MEKSLVYATAARLSVVVPCYNEENTLEPCISRVLAIADENLSIEIIIVNDCSSDRTLQIALGLERRHPEIRVISHERTEEKVPLFELGFRM